MSASSASQVAGLGTVGSVPTTGLERYVAVTLGGRARVARRGIRRTVCVTEADEEERHAVVTPVRAVTRRDDAVLRDPRRWHRSMPNPGTEAGHMIE